MNNQDKLQELSSNLVDRINDLNRNVNDVKLKNLTESEKELKLLNDLFVSIRKVIHYYTEKQKNK